MSVLAGAAVATQTNKNRVDNLVRHKKIKLCVVVSSHWAATFGGAQYQAKCIIDELIQTNNYDIYYLSRDVNINYTPEGYNIIQIGSGRHAKKFPLYLDAVDLYRVLKKIDPDILYQRVLNSYTGISAYYAKKYNKKMIWHIAHDDDVQPFVPSLKKNILNKLVDQKIGQYGIKKSHKIIAQTQRQNNFLQKYYNRQADAVIHNFQPKPTESLDKGNGIKIVWVGNFKPMKRPELFVKLAEDLVHLEDVKLEMIGRPGNQRQYGMLLEKILKMNNLYYHGEQPLAEVNRILSGAHLFVNTSVAEGFPNTFIQAWMRKVPVISLGVDVDDLLQTRKYGVCVNTYEGLLAEIIELIANRERIENMANNSQKLAFQYFSLDNAKQIMQVMADP